MSENNSKAAQPMDPSAREGASPEYVTRRVRNAYSLDVLLHEVEQVFGEVPYTLGEPDEWQVISEVTFDTQGVENAPEVLAMVAPDLRVEGVYDNEGADVRVQFHRNRRTRDLLDGFGLAEVLAVYLEDDIEDDYPDADEGVTEDGVTVEDAPNDEQPVPSDPEPEPVYISKASGKRVTRAYGEANPDKVDIQ